MRRKVDKFQKFLLSRAIFSIIQTSYSIFNATVSLLLLIFFCFRVEKVVHSCMCNDIDDIVNFNS